jgi:hypothetical protein
MNRVKQLQQFAGVPPRQAGTASTTIPSFEHSAHQFAFYPNADY